MSRFARSLMVAGCSLVSLAVQFGSGALPAQAVVIYREVFTGVNNTPTSTVGWNAQVGPTAAAPGSSTLSTTGEGPSPNPAPINSNPIVGAPARTFHGGTVGQAHIFWTNEYTVDASSYALANVGFWEFHDNANDDPQRFVAQVGGNWYITDQLTSLTGNTDVDIFALVWEEQTLNLSTATWRNLAFVPGTVLSVGAPTLLPAGDITAFGLYTNSYSSNLRFDTFRLGALEVVAIPEPSTWAILLLGAASLLQSRRRSRRGYTGRGYTGR